VRGFCSTCRVFGFFHRHIDTSLYHRIEEKSDDETAVSVRDDSINEPAPGATTATDAGETGVEAHDGAVLGNDESGANLADAPRPEEGDVGVGSGSGSDSTAPGVDCAPNITWADVAVAAARAFMSNTYSLVIAVFALNLMVNASVLALLYVLAVRRLGFLVLGCLPS